MDKDKSALGIFFKLPEIGRVKKRLAAQTSDEYALKVYKAMLTETIKNVQQLKDVQKFGFYLGGMNIKLDFTSSITCIPQKGFNLGQRMSNALSYLFDAGYEKVVLIGSDSPDLPVDYMQNAFYMLDSFEVVIGPAIDGGYYLIGMNMPFNEIFKGVVWGHDDVLKKTLLKTKKAGLNYFLLPEWYDIDDLANLTLWLKNQDSGLNILKQH